MQFDPKLIHPEEPPLIAGGELDLPGDLAALGEQLSADAAHLAACYPAAPVQSAAAGRSSAWKMYAAFVLGPSLAALLVAVIVWQSLPEQPSVNRTAAAVPATSSAIAAPHAGDTVSLVELSGPELDRLLDLLDRAPDRVTSISF